MNILKKLINMANELDKKGLITESSQLDAVINVLATDPFIGDWQERQEQIDKEKEFNQIKKLKQQKLPADLFHIAKNIDGFQTVENYAGFPSAVGIIRMEDIPAYLAWNVGVDELGAEIQMIAGGGVDDEIPFFHKDNPNINDVRQFANMLNSEILVPSIKRKITLYYKKHSK